MSHELQIAREMDQVFIDRYNRAESFAINPQETFDHLVTLNPDNALQCFNNEHLTMCCVDERLHAGNLAYAGSTCLAESPAEAVHYAEQRAQELGKRLASIASHDKCGAAGMKGIDPQEFSKDLCQRTRVPYAGHFEVDQPEFHDGVAIYYSGTESIGFQELPPNDLPKGFRISRQYYANSQAALYEAGVCVQIAFGDHGMGDRFTPEKPLLIIALGSSEYPEFSADALAQELTLIENDRIKIVPVTYTKPAAS